MNAVSVTASGLESPGNGDVRARRAEASVALLAGVILEREGALGPTFNVASLPESFAADLGRWWGEVGAGDVAPGGAPGDLEQFGDLGGADEVEHPATVTGRSATGITLTCH